MNRIPNPTNIMGTPYKIKTIKNLKDDTGCFLLGQLDPLRGEIRIIPGMNKYLKEKTWMHETLHGICKEINVKLTETETDNLANTLYDVFTRNKVNFAVK